MSTRHSLVQPTLPSRQAEVELTEGKSLCPRNNAVPGALVPATKSCYNGMASTNYNYPYPLSAQLVMVCNRKRIMTTMCHHTLMTITTKEVSTNEN